MKYYIIAGEASGDLHGSNLMKGIKKVDPDCQFRILGGDLMEAQGGVILKHYRNMAFMGLVTVIKNLKTIIKNLNDCKTDILQFNPDVVILIDYPGFNLRMAKFAHRKGIQTFYYISPKIWAWKKNRIKQIKAYVDRMFVIFPFEKEYYHKKGFHVYYEGNPLVDAITEFKTKQTETKEEFIQRHQLNHKPIIALLAGSRTQEIEYCLQEMLEAAVAFPDFQLVIAGVSSIGPSFYSHFTAGKNVSVIYGETYSLLSHAHMAIVTSGTATLETALFKLPQVVVYKTQTITYLIGKPLVNLRYFSLVNLVAGRQVVKEILQFGLKVKIQKELNRMIQDQKYREKMISGYDEIELMLGQPGVSERIASIMIQSLGSRD